MQTTEIKYNLFFYDHFTYAIGHFDKAKSVPSMKFVAQFSFF